MSMSYTDMFSAAVGTSNITIKSPSAKNPIGPKEAPAPSIDQWTTEVRKEYSTRFDVIEGEEARLKKELAEFGLKYETLKESLDGKYFNGRGGVLGVFDDLGRVIERSLGNVRKLHMLKEKAGEIITSTMIDEKVYRRNLFGGSIAKEVAASPGKTQRYDLAMDIYQVLEVADDGLSTYDLRVQTRTLDRRVSSFYTSLARLERDGQVERVEKKEGKWPWSKKFQVYRLTAQGRDISDKIQNERDDCYNDKAIVSSVEDSVKTYQDRIDHILYTYQEHIADYRRLKGLSKSLDNLIPDGTPSIEGGYRLLKNLKNAWSVEAGLGNISQVDKMHSF